MIEIFVHSLIHAVMDCLKTVPILFLAYLLVSYLSHDHSHKFGKVLSKKSKAGVIYASFLGSVPQCGFSSVMADLYSHKKVSLGVLVAVFVATSDEAIPIMITEPNSIVYMLMLIGIKIALALFWGYAINITISLLANRKKKKLPVEVAICKEVSGKCEVVESHHEHEEECHEHEIEEGICHHHECGHIHTDTCSIGRSHEHSDCCANNIFLDACMHTFNILIYIFVATFLINIIINSCGPEGLQSILTTNPYVQILVASLIGLIPNCAASVFLVEFMLTGVLSFPALVAGLTAGAGVGLFILCSKNRKHPLQSIGIIFLQYAIGVASGLFLTLFF